MKTYAPDFYADYQRLANTSLENRADTYLSFTVNDIDYVLSEKADSLLVIPAGFDWRDIGSYKDLHEIVAKDGQRNHLVGRIETDVTNNTFVINQEDKPVAVIGLDNAVIVNTPEGLLVTRQDLSQKVGEVSRRFYPAGS